MTRGDKETRLELVAADGTRRSFGRVVTDAGDLALVDVLMRLQLDAQREGQRIELHNPSRRLSALLELIGLSGVLGSQAGGQPELGEQRRGDEVVQPDDPVA